MSWSITHDWVRGFVDRSSQLVRGPTPAIVLTASTDLVLRPLFRWLKRRGWEPRLSKSGKRWSLRLSGTEQLERWLNEIGFFDPEKRTTLSEVLRVAAT